MHHRCFLVVVIAAFLIQARAHAGLVITEIMHSPTSHLSANPSAEWVEIYNQAATPIDLSEYILFGAVDPTFGAAPLGQLSGILEPGGFAIAFDGLDPVPFIPPFGPPIFDSVGYSNASDFAAEWKNLAPGTLMVQLNSWFPVASPINPGTPEFSLRRASDLSLIDIVSDFVDSPWPGTAQNQSIYLSDLSFDNSLASNWQASVETFSANVTSGTSSIGESEFASPGFFPANGSNLIPEPSSLTIFMGLLGIVMNRRSRRPSEH